MVSPTGAIPPIYVPPGYVSHVIEENGVRRVIVIPSSALGLDGPTGFINPHSMHVNMQPVHPGVFAPTVRIFICIKVTMALTFLLHTSQLVS